MTGWFHAEQLRAWAKGLLTLEAGTELLIRGFDGKFAQPGNAWVKEFDSEDGYWIDFEAIPHNVGVLSGGERRYLTLAASIASDTPVILDDAIPGLDVKNLRLVLAAIAHASGQTRIYPWPVWSNA